MSLWILGESSPPCVFSEDMLSRVDSSVWNLFLQTVFSLDMVAMECTYFKSMQPAKQLFDLSTHQRSQKKATLIAHDIESSNTWDWFQQYLWKNWANSSVGSANSQSGFWFVIDSQSLKPLASCRDSDWPRQGGSWPCPLQWRGSANHCMSCHIVLWHGALRPLSGFVSLVAQFITMRSSIFLRWRQMRRSQSLKKADAGRIRDCSMNLICWLP